MTPLTMTLKYAVAYYAEVSVQRTVDVFLLNMSKQLFSSTSPGHIPDAVLHSTFIQHAPGK